MTTKAAPRSRKRSDPLLQLAKAEAALAKAQETAQAAGRAHVAATERVKDLQERRRRMLIAEPELADHRGKAVDPGSALGRLDAELAELDLEDLQLRSGHAQQLVQAAEYRWQGVVREHGEAIDEARRPEGEALVGEWQAKAAELAEVSERLVDFARRSMSHAATRGLDTRLVPIDAVADLARSIRRDLVANPPPVPVIEKPSPAPTIEEEE